MTMTMHGMIDRAEDYRGFTISWQEPPLTSAKWTANVATESLQLLNLMGRNGAEVIDGRSRNDMLANAKRYIDTLLARTRPETPGAATTTVRDLFLEALSKKANDVPWHEIHEHLINRGHDVGHSRIEETGADNKYELTFQTGEKIGFDGADYKFTRS